MTVVKADAYGHGAVAVARAALAGGSSWLGVYAVDEGVLLRTAGIGAPILVFGPFERPEAAQIVRYDLTPTIFSMQAARAIEELRPPRRIPYQVKIDTGLSRSGLHPADALPLLEALDDRSVLKLQGIYTHFVSSEDPSRTETTRQLHLFLDTVRRLEEAGYSFELKHTANTGATLSMPDSHLDLVRFGIGTYGYAPSLETSGIVPLTPVLSLITSLVRVHTVSPGTGVGYGHEFVSRRETRLALAPIGYGDGLSRTLGNGAGRVLIRGELAPIVGRISMDQITIDVTDVPGALVGDQAVLVGRSESREHDAEDLAAEAGTISYDILTSLLPRVPRLYSWGSRLYSPSDDIPDLTPQAR